MAKITKTYSIEESIYSAFDFLTTEKNINKSSFIEDLINKYLKDNNLEIVDKTYALKSDKNHIVTVLAQDESYYSLSDGSKIRKKLFMHTFTPIDSINPETFFSSPSTKNEKVDCVYPETFFNMNNKLYEDIVDELRKIDTYNIKDHDQPNKSDACENTLYDIFAKYSPNTPESTETIENKIMLTNMYSKYKDGGFATKSKLELCDAIIKVSAMNFSDHDRDYCELRTEMIKQLTNYKNSF